MKNEFNPRGPHTRESGPQQRSLRVRACERAAAHRRGAAHARRRIGEFEEKKLNIVGF